MGEFHGQILGILLVVAIFAVILTPMQNLFTGLVKSVGDEITLNSSISDQNQDS